MATGRTTLKNYRIYVDGYDLSGYSRSFGPLTCTYEEGVDDAVTFDVKKTWPGNATIGMGSLNGIFDNTATSGIHAILASQSQKRNIMIAVGIIAPPVNNDPCFVGQFVQTNYETGPSENPVTATINFQNTSGAAAAGSLNYGQPWGVLLHALAAETGASTAAGLDQLAGTTKGGYMMYHITAAAGTGAKTGVIKVQHSTTTNDNAEFSDLLSSGTLNCAAGVSGVVALAKGATVGQYIRFQTGFTLASSITYALAFVRGN
jgi:hypothetical protein